MILSIIFFILILGTIVLVHEFGHFFFAKLFGVYVYEFAIGMGPKLFGWKSKKGETSYSLRLIPIGGYCQMAGEGTGDDEKIPKDRLLQSKPVWQRFLIMFFGAGNNFILALIVLFFLGLTMGCPSNSTVIGVIDGSPAQIAGLMENDEITHINGNRTKTLDDLELYLMLSEGETEVTVLRNNQEVTTKVTPLTQEEAETLGENYTFGITFDQNVETGFLSSIKYAFTKFGALIRQMVITLKELFTGGVSVKELSGPVGIYSAVDQVRSQGFANLFYLLALLSINVGFINLIPFPAFDGGRILFLIIEKIKGSPVKAETENMIHNIGFFILLGLIILVTIFDIIKLF